VYERHQEGFDGVEFSRGNGAIMREIVDDPPCRAVIAQASCECPRLHEGYVRMPTLKVLAARWSLPPGLSLLRSARMSRALPPAAAFRIAPPYPALRGLSSLSFAGRAETRFLIARPPPLPPRTLRTLLSALRRQIDALLEIDMSQRSLLRKP
jgi:hypothetical protein